MGQFIGLTPSQKEEIRRLTQLANRRIKAAERAYKKAGKDILPSEIVGHMQLKEMWHTKNTPLSRSVKFENQKQYRKHLQYLRSFEFQKVGIKEYTQVQQSKTLMAVETSLDGMEVPKALAHKIEKMSAPELADFWNTYSDRSAKLGMRYSSGDDMRQTINEFFPEDIDNLLKVV